MIVSRQVFDYQEKPLIEKVKIKVPFRYEALFPNEGCFLYIKGAKTRVLSSESISHHHAQEGVLLKCGTYFVDWIQHSGNEEIEVIAFHLYPKVLSHLYQQELPGLIKKQLKGERVSALANDAIIERFIENLQFYFDNPKLVNDDVLELKIKELILLLVQSKSASTISDLFMDLFSPGSANIKEVITTHLYSNLSIPQLAQLCGMSTSSFKREFEKIYHSPPNQYLIDKRIKRSCELLKTTSRNVSEIAFATGFNDPAYFARMFKKKTCQSPTDFRMDSKSQMS